MIDTREYKQYSAPLAQQMLCIAQIGPRFLKAIRAAESGGVPLLFIADAIALAKELDGQPGDGALEVYRDLDSNLQSTIKFIGQWQNSSDSGVQCVVQIARETHQELGRMKEFVSSTPPHVMAEIKQTLRGTYGSEHMNELQRFLLALAAPLGITIEGAMLGIKPMFIAGLVFCGLAIGAGILIRLTPPAARFPAGRTKQYSWPCAAPGCLIQMGLVHGGMTMTRETFARTQGGYQCQACMRLFCYDHSDNRGPCECGAHRWSERTYLPS